MRKTLDNVCVCVACIFQLVEAHLSRDKAIKTCIIETSEVVGRLREARAKDSDNLSIIKQLRKEQNKVVCLFTEVVYICQGWVDVYWGCLDVY